MLGFSLNLVSLLAITLATGILVDDAIVEIENIVRHMRMGKIGLSGRDRCRRRDRPRGHRDQPDDRRGLRAGRASSSNIAGQYFKQFGLTVAAEVMFSLLAARLITPMLAAYFLKPHPTGGGRKPLDAELRQDRQMVGRVNRYKTVADRPRAVRRIDPQHHHQSRVARLPAGAGFRPFASCDRTARQCDACRYRGSDGACRRRVAPSSRSDGRLRRWRPHRAGMPEVRKAQITVNYVPKTARKLSVLQLQALITKDLDGIAGMRHWFADDYGARPVARIFTGADGAASRNSPRILPSKCGSIRCSATLSRRRRGSIARNCRSGRKHDEMGKLGVTNDALSQTVRIATIGLTDSDLAKVDIGGQYVPIRIALQRQGPSDPRMLGSLLVPTKDGGSVPLGAVADIQFGKGPVTLTPFRPRRARRRSSAISSDRAALGDVEEALNTLPLMQHMPEGIAVAQIGNGGRRWRISAAALPRRCATASILVYIVLVLLFARGPAADRHSLLAAAVDRRRHSRAARHRPAALAAGHHRHFDADGHRHQERHHARRFRQPRHGARHGRAPRPSPRRERNGRGRSS